MEFDSCGVNTDQEMEDHLRSSFCSVCGRIADRFAYLSEAEKVLRRITQSGVLPWKTVAKVQSFIEEHNL